MVKMTNISVLLGLFLVFSLTNGNYISSRSKSQIPLEIQLQKLANRFESSESKWQETVQKQEMEITFLKEEVEYQKSLLNNMNKVRPVQLVQSKASALRTCDEIYRTDPTSPSGEYTIDPDGNGEEEPFTVTCEMETRTTLVGHDTEAPTRITNCSAPGCYSRDITYIASQKQLSLLAQLSGSCRQYFKFNCLGVPFEFNGFAYAWWNDRDGVQREFWAGPLNDTHTCQCGLEKKCVDDFVTCNCDALAPEAAIDEGYVTDSDVLPMTKLNFGRASAASALGIHTLGKFECSGRPSLDGAPSSCGDLWQVGYSLNGIFLVKGKKDGLFHTVYCDFSKLPGEDGQEIKYGDADIGNTVYFYAQSKGGDTSGANVVFDDPPALNLGEGFTAATGTFKAPVSGIYFFAFDGAPASVAIKKGDTVSAEAVNGSLSATLSLIAEEEVVLVAGDELTAAQRHYSGLLLKQTDFSSLEVPKTQ